MNKVIYSQSEKVKKGRMADVVSVAIMAVICGLLLWVSGYLPYSWIIQLALIAVFAIALYGVMKNKLFDVTYVLYEDRLEFVRRYGFVTAENEVFPIDEAQFKETEILYQGKSYPFFPDSKMKEKLHI